MRIENEIMVYRREPSPPRKIEKLKSDKLHVVTFDGLKNACIMQSPSLFLWLIKIEGTVFFFYPTRQIHLPMSWMCVYLANVTKEYKKVAQQKIYYKSIHYV